MTNTGDFVHLHVHSDFSMLDGAAIPEPLVAEAARLHMPAIAITDHGSMSGAYAMYKAAQNAGIKPIIGIEGYLAPGDLHHTVHQGRYFGDGGPDDVSSKGAYTHITMLAETTEGMHNLFHISTQSYLDGMFYKPRASRELLAEHATGIIATTGCPSSEVQTLIRLGKYDEAVEAAGVYQSIFGKDNYYVEIMDHGLDIERRVISDLLRLSKDICAPLVATNDLHYVHRHDAHNHEALLCVQSGTTLNDPNRFKFTGDTYYLRPANEMREVFRDHPEACDNTLAIAERCNITFDEDANLMPKFPVPGGGSDVTYFKKEVFNGLVKRFGTPEAIPQDYKDRANFEADIIIKMGFPSYFLIVADFINWAKDQGILVGPGRGSVGGSLLAWALRITELDPIRHGLLFERFLNPERVSMPDIDIDFDDRRRGEVIQYVIDKYGDDRVAQIATFNIIKAKAAMKDASRVLDYPYSLGDRMSKAFPEGVMGKTVSLTDAFDPESSRYNDAADFRNLVAADRDAAKVLELARGLEGIKRGYGMHAAGVIMSEKPLSDTVPLMRSKKDGPVMTQFEYPQCEALGLVKMDFLGLSNLGTIDEAIRQIRRNRDIDIEIQGLIDTLDDPKTYEMLARGETLGVFQLDSPPMRALLKSMKPDEFDDISAVLALYRPGPMGANAHNDYADRKNGRKPVVPIHSELAESLKEVLGPTHGVIVYQEQVMAIAQKVAGYSLGKADMLRRAMGKKKKEILDKEYAGFHGGMVANGYSDEAIKRLWDILVPFADYAFNRCVTGDTNVYLGSANLVSDGMASIESLFDRLHGAPSKFPEGSCSFCGSADKVQTMASGMLRCRPCASWQYRFSTSGLTARALHADGRIRSSRIKDVHYNGSRAVYTVTLSDGSAITATDNHRHMTIDGWREVRDLSVGDFVAVIGSPSDETVRRYERNRLTDIEPTYAAAKLPTSERHGVNSLGYRNGASLALKTWTQTQKWECSVADCTRSRLQGDRIERAHLDGNRKNNDSSNLRMMCASHHKKFDHDQNSRTRRGQAGAAVEYSEIISIEYAGEQEVYDLEMDAPEHNWVGNGIVTHNSHSAGYGLLSYVTGWLKANFPTEYMAALLTTNSDRKDKTALYLAECRRMGIKVLPPSVNTSEVAYAADGDAIRFGMAAVRNVGELVVESIIAEREANGPYTSFTDFLLRQEMKTLNKRVVESLIRAGAFDEFGITRAALHAAHDKNVSAAAAVRKHAAKGQVSLFDEVEDDTSLQLDIPNLLEWPQAVLLGYEREVLGLYVSSHPLADKAEALASLTDTTVADIAHGEDHDGEKVTIAGLITEIAVKTTKKGDKMCIVTVEDLDASVEVVFFPRTYTQNLNALGQDRIVVVKGRVQVKDGGAVNIIADEATNPNLSALVARQKSATPFIIEVREEALTPTAVAGLKAILGQHKGDWSVHLNIHKPNGTTLLMALGDDLRVRPSTVLAQEVTDLFGVTLASPLLSA